ncbi:MAG: hypothetical protein C4555_03245 [Dehalococcoidia bacterium]|nr:MAG: hypothetical protein C4555_03245 [Dehalococcoidia bacterium]
MALEYMSITFPAPIGGINYSLPENLLDHVYSRDMQNVIIEDGLIKKRSGYTQVAASFPNANPVMEGFEYGDASGTLHTIFMTTQKLIEYTSPSTWTDRTGGSNFSGSASNQIFIAPVGGLATENLYFTNGVDNIKVWTGSGNWSNLTTTGFTSLKAKCLIGFKGHLVLGDTTEDTTNKFPYRIRWSTVGNPTTWNTTTAGFVNLVEDKTNSKVMCMHPMVSNLIVYKFGSIYQLTYQGDPNYFVPRMKVADRGAISRKGVAPFGDYHLVVTQDNIEVFDGAGFVKPAPGNRIKADFFGNLNWAQRELIFACGFPSRFEVWIIYPTGSSSVPDTAYCWNYKDDTWTKHVFADTIYSLMNFNESTFGGTVAIQPIAGLSGNVMKLFSGNNDNGTAIDGYFRTKLHNYREFSTKDWKADVALKTVQRIELDSTGALPTVQIGTVNSLLETVDYDTATAVAAGETGVVKVDKRKTGRYITMKVRENTDTTPFQVAQVTPFFEPQGAHR